MTITGIIAEFNPFHNGHKYLLEQAQGLKIIAMSGNFVQRGEPAIVDKWIRTQMALENGADLVVELPFLVAVQSADYFAKGAIAILEQLGIEQLVFGTEEALDYQRFSDSYAAKQHEMSAFLNTLPKSMPYPQKTQKMWQMFSGIPFSGETPNHILGLAYAKACAGKNIALAPIKRVGEGFHSETKAEIASATAIRKHILDCEFVKQSTPSADMILGGPQVTWDCYFDLLKYQIVTNPDLKQLFQVNDELAHRLYSTIGTAKSLAELVEKVATKRYTKARIQRLLTYILVGAYETSLPKGIHVLGFSKTGQQHLASLKNRTQLVSRIGKEPWDSLTQKADRVYQLGHPQIAEQTWGRVPLML